MTQRNQPPVEIASAIALTSGIFAAQYAGAPRTKSGLLWAHEYPSVDCWVEGTPVTNGAKFNNLFAELGQPDNGQVLTNGGMTYVDQAGGAASGFQMPGTSGNMLQIDAGTDFLQSNMTHDFFFSCSDVYPNTSAIDTNQFVFSKTTSATANSGSGLFLCRFGGRSGIAPVTMHVRCSDTTGTFFDYENTNVAPAGSGPGFHYMAVARVSASLRIYNDGVLIGTATPSSGTFSSNSNSMTHGNRVSAGTGNIITGLKIISDMGLDLTLINAALNDGLTTAQRADKLAAQEWTWLNSQYGTFV